MNMTLLNETPSQSRRILKPTAQGIDSSLGADEILALIESKNICDKDGAAIAPILADMKEHEDAILICNLAIDDQYAPINAYLAANCTERLSAGLKLLAKAGGCSEIYIYAAKDIDTSALTQQLNGDIKITAEQGEKSLVLREKTALYSQLDDGVIRVNKVELEFDRAFLSQGLQKRPALMVDAETACNVTSAAEDADAEMTKLVVINTDKQILAEVKLGTSIAVFMNEAQLATNNPLLVGGTLGKFVDAASDETIGYDWISDSITILSDNNCMVKTTAELMEYAKDYSCQKCVMCREGSFQLSSLYTGIIKGKGKREDVVLIEDIAPLIMQGTICGFGEKMAQLAYSSALVNKAEIEAHIVKKTCSAGACDSFKSYFIDPELCTGCEDCVDACDFDAIEGKKKFIHVIDQKACEKCGACQAECPEDAIVTQKIRVPKKPVKVGTF